MHYNFYLLYKLTKAFTGDTLFIGSVGRPDLVSAPKDSQVKDANEMRKVMAGKMYQTLTTKIFGEKTGLPDKAHVHPAHGAGSPCGANLRYILYVMVCLFNFVCFCFLFFVNPYHHL